MIDWFQMAYTAVGGLGIFFLGLRYLSDSLQAISGDLIRRMISSVTSNRFLAVFVGVAVTTLIQSSSISTVMVVGLVNAGLMQLTQAIGVILGANIGTTITGWILAVKVGKYGLLFIALGIFPMLFVKRGRAPSIGKILVALGMIFLGLELMSGAFKPLRTSEEFISYLALFDPSTAMGLIGCVVAGCVLTLIIQSSSAMLGITIALAATGTINYPTAAALVLGENIGTTITALLASIGTNVGAKRAAVSHSIFNVVGVLIILSIFPWFVELIQSIVPGDPDFINADGAKPYIAAHIAMGHSVFNIAATIIMLPFITPFAALIERIIPQPKEKELRKLKYLHTAGVVNSEVALNMAELELANFAEISNEMLELTQAYFTKGNENESAFEEVSRLEVITDNIQEEITSFVCQIMEGHLTLEQSERAYSLIRAADELESLCDSTHSLCVHRKRLLDGSLTFSEKGWEDVLDLLHGTLAAVKMVTKFNVTSSPEMASKIRSATMSLSKRVVQIRNAHLDRMQEGEESPQAALVYSDIIVSLKRVKDHALNLFEATNYSVGEREAEAPVG